MTIANEFHAFFKQVEIVDVETDEIYTYDITHKAVCHGSFNRK